MGESFPVRGRVHLASIWCPTGLEDFLRDKLFLAIGDFMDEEDLGGLAMVETLKAWGKT